MLFCVLLFLLNPPAPTAISPLSLHDALPISASSAADRACSPYRSWAISTFAPESAMIQAISGPTRWRSEEHTSELQSRGHLVCRLLLEKKNTATTGALKTPTEALDFLGPDVP